MLPTSWNSANVIAIDLSPIQPHLIPPNLNFQIDAPYLKTSATSFQHRNPSSPRPTLKVSHAQLRKLLNGHSVIQPSQVQSKPW